ncbi:MAG TPA: hypothetical protein VF469_31940 [Kofleriaceae bacterium]
MAAWGRYSAVAIDTVFRFHHGPTFSVLFTGEGNGGFPEGPLLYGGSGQCDERDAHSDPADPADPTRTP